MFTGGEFARGVGAVDVGRIALLIAVAFFVGGGVVALACWFI